MDISLILCEQALAQSHLFLVKILGKKRAIKMKEQPWCGLANFIDDETRTANKPQRLRAYIQEYFEDDADPDFEYNFFDTYENEKRLQHKVDVSIFDNVLDVDVSSIILQYMFSESTLRAKALLDYLGQVQPKRREPTERERQMVLQVKLDWRRQVEEVDISLPLPKSFSNGYQSIFQLLFGKETLYGVRKNRIV